MIGTSFGDWRAEGCATECGEYGVQRRQRVRSSCPESSPEKGDRYRGERQLAICLKNASARCWTSLSVSSSLRVAIHQVYPAGSATAPARSPQNWSAIGICTVAPALTARW